MSYVDERKRLLNVLLDAEVAFWDIVNAEFPEIKTTDSGVTTKINISVTNAGELLKWLKLNT